MNIYEYFVLKRTDCPINMSLLQVICLYVDSESSYDTEVTHFLFSPKETEEVVSYEDFLQSFNKDLLSDDLASSVVEGLDQSLTFRPIDENCA